MKPLRSLGLFVIASLFSVTAYAEGGDVEAGQQKSTVCAGCHGADGNSVNPEWPKLAGQSEKYLFRQLNDFKSKRRENPLMSAQAAGLSEQDMRDLAAYFAAQKRKPGSASPDAVALGQQVYRGGNLQTGVPACMGCHEPTGAGNPMAAFPALSGQHPKYVESQLRSYRDGLRDNDPDGVMRGVAARMRTAEIAAVSQYVSGLH